MTRKRRGAVHLCVATRVACRLRAPAVLAVIATLTVAGRPASAVAESLDVAATGAIDAIVGRVAAFDAAAAQDAITAFSLFLGILLFAVVTAVLYVRTRNRLRLVERTSREEIGELGARVERAEGLLAADQNVLVVWPPDRGEPEIHCHTGLSQVLPSQRSEVLAFGKWLDADSAVELEAMVHALRERGEGFNVMLRTRQHGYIEADGRSSGGRVVLRMRDLAGQRRELAEIYSRHKKVMRDVEALRALLDRVPMPAWLADAGGRLSWVNRAYGRGLGYPDGEGPVLTGRELIGAAGWSQLNNSRDKSGTAHREVLIEIGGSQRLHDVWEVAAERFRAGIAVDVSELDSLRVDLDRRSQTHARTLDLVSTAVAVFGPDQRLVFHNRSFAQFWGLDAAWLNEGPGFDEILDRLRAAGRIQEPVDYRGWRADQLAVFSRAGAGRSGDTTTQTLWHLPDGRAVRVVLGRQGDGTVCGLFEDVTQSIDLESRLVALTQVQRETLDSLEEGIAVFGTDGLLKLCNRAFTSIWKLPVDQLGSDPHVERVIEWCRGLYPDDDVWAQFRAVVTSLVDTREALSARLERPDRSIIDLRAVPLPDGATLAVFTDVSDSARIERALRDRNEALVTAARIKNEFVHKVSYELRAPLTSVIGFAQLMSMGEPGALSERQREYAGHILTSSSALLAIINDILDLATIDAGVMQLDFGVVDISSTVAATTESLRDRLTEAGIRLVVEVPAEIGTFEADEKRVRQILFNLLSNAIAFSERGQTVRIACQRDRHDRVVFTVEDKGRGIPEDVRRTVFERFESHALGTDHRGAGLGLSIVKSFVELHRGTVRLDSRPGQGTIVTCSFPAQRPANAGKADIDQPATGEIDTLDEADAPLAPAAPEREGGNGDGERPQTAEAAERSGDRLTRR